MQVSVATTPDVNALNRTIRAASPFLTMDMKNLKWMWTGLTFSKTSSAKPTAPPTPSVSTTETRNLEQAVPAPPEETKVDALAVPAKEVEIDTESLREAISSVNEHGWASNLPSPSQLDTATLPPLPADSDLQESTEASEDEGGDVPTEDKEITPRVSREFQHEDLPSHGNDPPPVLSEPSTEEPFPRVPPPDFLSTTVYLATGDNPLHTVRHKVHHATVSVSNFHNNECSCSLHLSTTITRLAWLS